MSLNYPAIDSDAAGLFDTPNLTGTPERRLLLAVLERALLDYVGNDLEEARSADDWIFEHAENEDESAFSFAWICKELDLEVKDIRNKVRSMPKRGASRIAPWYLTKTYGKTKSIGTEASSSKGKAKVLDFVGSDIYSKVSRN